MVRRNCAADKRRIEPPRRNGFHYLCTKWCRGWGTEPRRAPGIGDNEALRGVFRVNLRIDFAAGIEYHAVLRANLATDLKAGSHLVLRGVTVIEFLRGKIVRLTDYG